jgi:hypothetical protein
VDDLFGAQQAVHRDHHGTERQHAVVHHREVRCVRQQQSDPVAGAHIVVPQHRRVPAGGVPELGVGDAFGAEDERGVIGASLGGLGRYGCAGGCQAAPLYRAASALLVRLAGAREGQRVVERHHGRYVLRGQLGCHMTDQRPGVGGAARSRHDGGVDVLHLVVVDHAVHRGLGDLGMGQ